MEVERHMEQCGRGRRTWGGSHFLFDKGTELLGMRDYEPSGVDGPELAERT